MAKSVKSQEVKLPPRKRIYSNFYLTNGQYGGYSYIEEDPAKKKAYWPKGMADFVNPYDVLSLAERAGVPEISLAGDFWRQLGYKGTGQKVSVGEARTALQKAKQHTLGTNGHSGGLNKDLENKLRQSPQSEGKCSMCGKAGHLYSGVCRDCFIRWATDVSISKRR